jgi:hypothetical protein
MFMSASQSAAATEAAFRAGRPSGRIHLQRRLPGLWFDYRIGREIVAPPLTV